MEDANQAPEEQAKQLEDRKKLAVQRYQHLTKYIQLAEEDDDNLETFIDDSHSIVIEHLLDIKNDSLN